MVAAPAPSIEDVTPENAHAGHGKKHAQWVYDAIQAGSQYHFKTKTPWVHNAINVGAYAGLLAGIVGTVIAGQHLHWGVYLPVAAIVFGLLYFGLFILVVHEASHNMFVISRDKARARWWNRAFGWSVSVLFGVHYDTHWAVGHLEHHVRPLEESDPQRFSLPVGDEFKSSALKYLLIPGFLFYDRTVGRKRKKGGKAGSTKSAIIAFVVIWATLLPLTGILLGWPIPVAMFWGVHVVAAWNLAKGGMEHGGAIGQEPDPMFRSRTTLFPGRPVLMPFNITLHFEHHLNFTVPWYDLVRYHRDLEQIVPEEVWRHIVNRRPFEQLMGRLDGLTDEARALTLP